MKKISLFFVVLLAGVQLFAQNDTLRIENADPESDSVEYELIIIDSGFDSFLMTQPSMEFYSQQYYENWNYQYVIEWNLRYSQPLTYGDLYETYIDYHHDIDYGYELNYKLYYYFRFFEKKNKLVLIPGRKPLG